MITVPGYHIDQIILDKPAITVCHATSEEHSREVLLKIVKQGNRAIKEIAARLMMSAGTVKVHVRNLFDKLQVNNRVKAVAMAAKLNVSRKQ
jgi:DNA-binding CsgD family transcriptional regulator